MQAIVVASRNNYWEKKLAAEVETKIQAIGFGLATASEATAAVLISDGRPLLKTEQDKLKNFLKDKTVVKPHKLLVIYHIADDPVPDDWAAVADFIAKDIYDVIGCLKDYWFFSHNT